jgi:hypothetical protein
MKIKLRVTNERETIIQVYEGDTAFTVAERCLKPEFKSTIPKELINELASIVQM